MTVVQPIPRSITKRSRREAEAEAVRSQIRKCYDEYTPAQLRDVAKKIEYGTAHDEHTKRVEEAKARGEICWERIGRSHGGGRKRNLYRCLVS
jgi:hypothetical protein